MDANNPMVFLNPGKVTANETSPVWGWENY